MSGTATILIHEVKIGRAGLCRALEVLLRDKYQGSTRVSPYERNWYMIPVRFRKEMEAIEGRRIAY